MRKTIKQVRRDAKHLFRLCLVNGSLDDDRVRLVMQHVLGSKRGGYLSLATQFERLVRLERLRHTAKVESATPLPPDLQAEVGASLARLYGRRDKHFVRREAGTDRRHANQSR